MSGRRGMPPHAADQPPVKKRGKWSREENALIIKLRRCNTTWNNISNHLPGRGATGCRQHYQAHLEGRSEGDEELKNKPARLYERSKSEMRAKVAEVMAVPRPTAEAMQWQLGEADMARRTGAIPSSLAAVNVDRNYNFVGSPLPRELNSQHSSLQNDGFPCVVAVQHPSFCDKSFPDLSAHNVHLNRCHSPMDWCKDCLQKVCCDLREEAVAKAMAIHEKSCTKNPTEKNKLRWQKHYIIDDGVWMEFKRKKWKDIDVPKKFDQDGHREPVPQRRWRQISELIFPSGPTDTLSSATCQKSILLPHPLPAIPDPAEVQYPRGKEKQRNGLRQKSLICPPRPSAVFPDPSEYVPGPRLAPIQYQLPPRMLPGVAELTSGVSPYIKPAAALRIQASRITRFHRPGLNAEIPQINTNTKQTSGAGSHSSHLPRQSGQVIGCWNGRNTID
ncbi:Myb-related protein A [Fusarium oxysporum f. sp. phaseoli]